MIVRRYLLIKGVVQGVGFRPFIYNLAAEYDLRGWVLNSTDGVHIEVEGPVEKIEGFISQIRPKAPPLARIDSIEVRELEPVGYAGFAIRHSEGDSSKYIKISPDVSICDDCLRELLDPTDRRYLYPFINCTNCGPRFTIIRDIPYDRHNTTMKPFKMCGLCQAEYDDPSNRRFHAQPNACHTCGPHVWLERSGSREIVSERGEAISEVIRRLAMGEIVAIKGLGGFHLACDASNQEATARLRGRKRKSLKPFAIMSPDIETIKTFCFVSDQEERLLSGYQRPIVLLRRKPDAPIAEAVAPNNEFLGVMLPYTPLHYLLFHPDLRPEGVKPFIALVMTSGNLSEEPIAIDNEEARERLKELADWFLMHNREICTRCDDSVAKVDLGTQIMIRRSRGYAPYPVDLHIHMPQILACGAELKNTFCLTKENHAFLSQHIGELKNVEAFKFFADSIQYMKRLFRIEPEFIAYDLHPEYLSTKYAMEFQDDLELIGVQHHHAHIASCMAEKGIEGKVIGVSFDGTGYGTDGRIWGGEFLVADEREFVRVAHLRYLPLPGGDAAVREPYRMALSYLWDLYGDELWEINLPMLKGIDPSKLRLILRMIERRINSPLTSSCGRLFDAVSALAGVRSVISYEAQAAMELEMRAWREGGLKAEAPSYGWDLIKDGNPWQVDMSETIRGVVEDVLSGRGAGWISHRFHQTVADVIATLCREMRREFGLNDVVLSGGVFQNRLLLNLSFEKLAEQGFRMLFNREVPPNDGGISLGQAYIAASRVRG